MRSFAILVPVSTLVLVLAACSHKNSDDANATSAAAATEATPIEGFVGCRPSAGECANSCADHRFLYLDPDDRCSEDEGACVCGEGEKPPQTEPPPGTFVGCRPSAGECMNSCPTHAGTYVTNWKDCPEAGDPLGMHGGCFCR